MPFSIQFQKEVHYEQLELCHWLHEEYHNQDYKHQGYMVTTLYNAPSTINHYYQQEVQHDMYGGGWHEKGIV